MTLGMPITRQFVTTFEKGMEYMPLLKYDNCMCKHKEYSSIPVAALMIPGSLVLGAGFIASVCLDVIRDTALAALNVLGIAITLGNSSRSALFRSNLNEHKKHLKEEIRIIIDAACYVPFDVLGNAIFGPLYIAHRIAQVYLAILDKTPISRFFPDQA